MGRMLGDEIAKRVGGKWVDAVGETMAFERLECRPDRLIGEGDCLFGVFEEYWCYNEWCRLEMMEEWVREFRPKGIVARRRVEGYAGAQLLVSDVGEAFGRTVRLFEGEPDGEMEVIGVTGTNGKTSTVVLISSMLKAMGKRAGRMGTLGTWVDGEEWAPGEYTTDVAMELYGKLGRMRAVGVEAVAMEVSSHGLALGRVAGLEFAGAVVTNVTRDHLEFHGTLERYWAAKRRLVEGLKATAVVAINMDDPVARTFLEGTKAEVVGFGRSEGSDLRLIGAEHRGGGTAFEVAWRGRRFKGRTELAGQFQLMNLLGAMAVLVGRGYGMERVIESAGTVESVPGRMETVGLASGAVGVIDYAHNPDGLEHLLIDVQALKPRRLILVFGCGGDRDVGKRPLMGALASRYADLVWITSDNPRTEDPVGIIKEIEKGVSVGAEVRIEKDRRRAIEAACREAGEGDVVVVAGKGHEGYQQVGEAKIPFSDREELKRFG